MNPFKYLWNILLSLFPTTLHTQPVKVISKSSHKKWTRIDDIMLIDMWEDNASIQWLAVYFDRSEDSIKSRLIKLGYSTKKNAPRTRTL